MLELQNERSLKQEVCGFVLSDCAEKEVAPEGRDDEIARNLWEESARLVGLTDTC